MIAALDFFIWFSKSKMKGNVILVSSEHDFPWRLSSRPVRFGLDNLTGFLYAGEAPPKDMLRVLRERWGAGPHLAHSLVAHYGGNVWETYSALDKLRRGENQALRVGLDSAKIVGVQACLTWRPEGASDVRQQQDRMRQVLERLATRGFVPLRDHDDEVAKVISQHGVGGVVMRGALVEGLPAGAWEREHFGLVPATQAMRLAIASQLGARG